MRPGAAIARARKHAGLAQVELAARAGTSQATLSAYENGRKQPSARTFMRLLAATGTRLTLTMGRRPVLEPSDAQLARVARSLRDVLDLADALPTRHEPELRFPRLPVSSGSR